MGKADSTDWERSEKASRRQWTLKGMACLGRGAAQARAWRYEIAGREMEESAMSKRARS